MRSFMKSRRHSSSSESDVAYVHPDSDQRSSKRNSFSSPTSTKSLSQSNIHQSYMEMNLTPTFEPLSPVRHNKANFFQRLTKKNPQSILTSPKLETNPILLNKSKSSVSLSDQGLPIIQGTITHEWGTPKVVRKGSPIVLDKKPDDISAAMETPVRDTSLSDLASKNLDSKKKNNRSARIFSNQDFLNLVVDNDEGIELIDKLKTVSLDQEELTSKNMKDVEFSTPQNRSEEFNLWGNDKELLSPNFSERSRNMSSSSSGSSNDSKFSFQFNSTYGRKSSVKYYGKKEVDEDLNSALYFDDIYGDEDFDEDYNVDEEDAYEESLHNNHNKSTTSFGFNNITALTDEEEEEGCEDCNSDEENERYDELQSYDIISDSNSIVQNDISKIYSEDIDTDVIKSPISPDSGKQKVQAQKKLASFQDLYALTDGEEGEEVEVEDYNEIKDFHKAHNNHVKIESHEHKGQKTPLGNVIAVGKTAVDNLAQIEKRANSVNVKKSHQVTKFNDLYDLSDDENNDNLGFNDDYYNSSNNFDDLYEDEDEEDYSELSDLTPRKPPLRFNAESELNNLKTPVLTRSPATPIAKKNYSSPLLGKMISNSNMSDTPMLASVLMTPKSPRSPVNRLPPNTILKYHDLTSSLDSGVVPRSMGDLYFIDELEEAHDDGEDEIYLDEINTVPEDFDFEDDCDRMSSSRVLSSRISKNSISQNPLNGTTGFDSYGGAKKSFGLLKKKSYKGSHSYNEKPASILKSNKPHPGKVELKNKDKTVTFFHISDHHLQRCNSDPGTVSTRKSNVWRHKSDILANSSVPLDNKLYLDQNFVERNKTFPNISEESRTSFQQISSKFGETNALSPIQER